MNILVTGCYGQLGTELRRLAVTDNANNWFFTDIDTLDICDRKAVEQYFLVNKIETCVNCAAYTAVDKAEDEPALARKVNTEAPIPPIPNQYMASPKIKGKNMSQKAAVTIASSAQHGFTPQQERTS